MLSVCFIYGSFRIFFLLFPKDIHGRWAQASAIQTQTKGRRRFFNDFATIALTEPCLFRSSGVIETMLNHDHWSISQTDSVYAWPTHFLFSDNWLQSRKDGNRDLIHVQIETLERQRKQTLGVFFRGKNLGNFFIKQLDCGLVFRLNATDAA